MKDFDYNAAKAGAPVCTRDGRPARIICWDYKEYGRLETEEKFPIIALVECSIGERAYLYRENGTTSDKNKDLMMLTVKHEGWVLIHPAGQQCSAHICDTKEEAEEYAEREKIAYSAVAHIEWEE